MLRPLFVKAGEAGGGRGAGGKGREGVKRCDHPSVQRKHRPAHRLALLCMQAPLISLHFLLIPSVTPFSSHIFVAHFRHTHNSRAGGRGKAPQHPVTSLFIASHNHPRLPCAQAFPFPCSFPPQLFPPGPTHFRRTFSSHTQLKGRGEG